MTKLGCKLIIVAIDFIEIVINDERAILTIDCEELHIWKMDVILAFRSRVASVDFLNPKDKRCISKSIVCQSPSYVTAEIAR